MIKIYDWSNRFIEFKGVSLMPYYCAKGKLYIGVERNLDDCPLNINEKRALGCYMRGITLNGAKMLLRNDIKRAYTNLKKIIFNFEKLDSNRQFAMIEMYLVLGDKKFRKHKRLRRFIGSGDYKTASVEFLMSDYAVEVPDRVKKIMNIILTGEW